MFTAEEWTLKGVYVPYGGQSILRTGRKRKEVTEQVAESPAKGQLPTKDTLAQVRDIYIASGHMLLRMRAWKQGPVNLTVLTPDAPRGTCRWSRDAQTA